MKTEDIVQFLNRRAPFAHAEAWDNVGILVGDGRRTVTGVVCSIEPTHDLVDFALAEKLNTIITHHPLMFRPTQTLTFEESRGESALIERLIREGINHICVHTNFDRAPQALHHNLCKRLGIEGLNVLEDFSLAQGDKENQYGYGLYGTLPGGPKGAVFLSTIKKVFDVSSVRVVGDMGKVVSTVGFMSGSGMCMYGRVRELGLDFYITGDIKYHEALEARTDGICLVDVGHFGTEKHFCTVMKEWLLDFSSSINVKEFWGTDPFQFM